MQLKETQTIFTCQSIPTIVTLSSFTVFYRIFVNHHCVSLHICNFFSIRTWSKVQAHPLSYHHHLGPSLQSRCEHPFDNLYLILSNSNQYLISPYSMKPKDNCDHLWIQRQGSRLNCVSDCSVQHPNLFP